MLSPKALNMFVGYFPAADSVRTVIEMYQILLMEKGEGALG